MLQSNYFGLTYLGEPDALIRSEARAAGLTRLCHCNLAAATRPEQGAATVICSPTEAEDNLKSGYRGTSSITT
jgi:hypothetical protein